MALGAPIPGAPGLDIAGMQTMLGEALAPRYVVLRPLGAGGLGSVFLARETALQRLVAVKVLARRLAEDAAARARVEREARRRRAVPAETPQFPCRGGVAAPSITKTGWWRGATRTS